MEKYVSHTNPNIIRTATDSHRLRLKDRRYKSSEQPTRTSEGPTPQQRNPSRNKEHVRIRSGRRHGGSCEANKAVSLFWEKQIVIEVKQADILTCRLGGTSVSYILVTIVIPSSDRLILHSFVPYYSSDSFIRNMPVLSDPTPYSEAS